MNSFVQQIREWSSFIMVLMLTIAGFIYLFPFIISIIKNHSNSGQIFFLNLFLGWTIIIWLITLIWACKKTDKGSDKNIEIKNSEIKIRELETLKSNNINISKNNKTSDFYINLISDLEKIYKLYSNGIYSEEEYLMKKQNWIDLLKNYDFIEDKLEIEFLEKISPLERSQAINRDDLDKIKYIVSGKYHIDKNIEIQTKTNKEKEFKKLVKSQKQQESKEKIISVKNNAMQELTDKKEKLRVSIQQSVRKLKQNKCSCGSIVSENARFCRSCGKQLKDAGAKLPVPVTNLRK